MLLILHSYTLLSYNQLKHLYIYLLLLIYVHHWYSNDNKCILTVMQNEL